MTGEHFSEQADEAIRDRHASVSVVTVTFFTGPVFYHAVDALLKQPEVKELIIVDNGNSDRTLKALRKLEVREERITLITGHGNVGFAKGCNIGAKQASGKYLLLLNPDALIRQETLGQMIAEGIELEHQSDRPWLLGVNLLDPDGTPQRGARRADLTPLSAFFEVFQFLSRFSDQLKEMRINRLPRPLTQTTEIEVISGACMFTRLAFYHAINGMDEDYFLHVEDIDFCFRFRRNGGGVYFCPKIELFHFQGTSQTTSNFIEWQKAKSFMTYFHKHYAGGWRLPFVLGLDLAILTRYLVLTTRNFLLVP